MAASCYCARWSAGWVLSNEWRVRSVTLRWTAPDDRGSPITGYEYRQSSDGGTSWDPDWTAIADSAPGGENADRFTVTGLMNDRSTPYTFEVRAVNTFGEGAASNQAPATPVAFTDTITVSTAALTVTVAVTETGAVIDGAAPDSVEFGIGEATVTLTVATENDTADEAQSVITAAVTVRPGGTATFTVEVDAGEGVEVERPNPVMVDYEVSGTAVAGTDYTEPSGTLTLDPRARTQATLRILRSSSRAPSDRPQRKSARPGLVPGMRTSRARSRLRGGGGCRPTGWGCDLAVRAILPRRSPVFLSARDHVRCPSVSPRRPRSPLQRNAPYSRGPHRPLPRGTGIAPDGTCQRH